MEIERLEHGQGMLRLGAGAMSAQMRNMQEERVFDELSELYEWQWEFGDKALLKRAAKIGIHLAEITFVDELAEKPPRCLAWPVTTSPCLASRVYLPRRVSLFG